MRDSLKNLVERFPFFLDKSESSNFTLSQGVTNNELKKIYQSLDDVIGSFHLDKRVLIWKEQTVPGEYVIQFRCFYKNIKSVSILKDDEVVYIEEYGYEDNINSFMYSYRGDTETDGSENISGIPLAKFKIIVTTHDEITAVKGWPENDEIRGDEFDHDTSLDNIGNLHNIPRKIYLEDIPQADYEYTEPPFYIWKTEDDYHYMNRIIEYTYRLHTTHPVLLELWKLYGVEATMQNRERLLIKMFDEDYHGGTYWAPQVWEHKDSFCKYTPDLGEYFFISPSTKTPVRGKPVNLTFSLKDMLANEIKKDYTVDIYLNGVLLEGDYTSKIYKLTNIPQDLENICRVECKNTTGELIGEDEVILSVKGCNNANLYIAENGNNNNSGTSQHPLKTLQYAINKTKNDLSTIAIQGGNYDITSYAPNYIKNSCTILGCGYVLLENKADTVFFKVPNKKSVSLGYLTLQHKANIAEVSDITIYNNNYDNSDVEVVMYKYTDEEYIEITRINMNVDTLVFNGDEITVSGKIIDKYNEGISGKTIRVTCPGSTPQNVTTNSNGEYSATLEITRIGVLPITAKFGGGNNYAPSRIVTEITSKLTMEDAFSGYDYVVMDMTYEDDEWKYTYKPTSEIQTLSDINGAISHLSFKSDKDVVYTRFSSTSTEPGVSSAELTQLKGLLMGIIYDDYEIKHTDFEVT